MVNYFQIHVTFGHKSTDLKCTTRREMLTKLEQFCELSKEDIEIYDVTAGSKKAITVHDLNDNMKIEIRRKIPSFIPLGPSRANGLRSETSEIGENVKIPDRDLLLKKLKENNTLNGLERKFMIQLVGDYFDDITFKRKRHQDDPPQFSSKKVQVSDDKSAETALGVRAEANKDTEYTIASSTFNHKRSREDSPQTSNKKVQVMADHLKQLKSTHTQTEDLTPRVPGSRKSSSGVDLNYVGKRLARDLKKDAAKVDKVMNDTFDLRRNFILMNNPVAALVKEKYPLLFSLSEVRNELNRIFYPDKDKEFLANVEKYSDVILGLIDEDDILLKIIKEKMKSASSPTQKQYAKEVGSLLMLSNLMKEKRMFLTTEDESYPANNYPHIEAPCKVNRIFNDVHTYKIIVEGHTLCEATTFQEATLCLIASYFIFNITYPSSVFNTLVVIEKIFLEANDTDINEIEDQTLQVIKLIRLKTTSRF